MSHGNNIVEVCACVVIPCILDVRFVDVPAGVTQEGGRTGFLHLPSAVLALAGPQTLGPKIYMFWTQNTDETVTRL